MDELAIWFSEIKISNKNKIIILNQFGSLEEVYRATNKKTYFNEKLNYAMASAYNIEKINNIKNKLKNINGNIISVYDNEYPRNLKEVQDYPPTIYYIGDINKINHNKNAAVIGSRRCSYYGEEVTRYIVTELAKNNINVISGLAMGIDAIAHNTAMECGGFTVGVLGCGIDVIYPIKNKKIFYNMYEKGCVISEFPLGTKPFKGNFPIRNRIISGLSEMIIVSEATMKSGTLITATHALNQGREVMVVPGNIFSEFSKGTNMLIKEGANPFLNLQDMVECIGVDVNKENYKKNKIYEKYKGIYEIINDSPIHIDDIIKITKIDISVLYELLFEMQFNKMIKCINGNYYIRNVVDFH